MVKHIKWDGRSLRVLDQRLLPHKIRWINCDNLKKVFSVIKNMNVRGAPLIGIVAGFGLLLHIKNNKPKNVSQLRNLIEEATGILSQIRPTAVNIYLTLERIQTIFGYNTGKKIEEIISILESEVEKIWAEDIEISKEIAEYGQVFIEDDDRILTHCNAGGLATGGYGTALGVLFRAKELGKNFLVYVDETRPVLQGARLTCWELKQADIPYCLITDNMAGFLMKQGKIKKVFVGADRVTRNGGLANKIGTYSIAVLAKIHNVQFYVFAPSTSFDLRLETEEEIPIEERDPEEILYINNKAIAPIKSRVENPAFDITPPELVTAIICERGVIKPPYEENISAVIKPNFTKQDSPKM